MKSAKTTKRKKVRTKTAISKSTSNIEPRSTDKRLLKLKHGQTWLKTVTVVNKSMLVTKKKDHSDSESKESYQDRTHENGSSDDRALAKPKSLQLLRIHELEGEGGGYVKKALSLPLVEKPKKEDKKSSGGVTSLLSTLSPRIPGTKSRSDKEKDEKEKERKEEKEREKKEKKEREEREKREKKEKEERERKEKKDKEERDKKDKKEKEKEKEKDKDKEELSQEEKEMELVTAKLKKHPVFSNVDPLVAGTVEGMMNEYFTPQKLRKINGEFAIKAKLQFVAMSMFSFKKLKYAPSIVLSTISEAVSEFGLVHAAVQIGPYRLDWNRAEISLPKEIRCDSEPLMLLDLKGGDLYVGYDYNKVAELCRKVCEISVRWNRTMHYSLGSHCQHFVNEVLETLNLQMEFEEPIDGYLRKLKKHGTAKMQFRDPFTHKKVKFKRHADIDRYANNLLARFPRFAEDYPNHWMFLKAFDRAFWACQMSYESSDESESDDDVTSLVEGKEREKDKHAAEKAFWMCPFGNPMDLLFGSFAGGVLETAMKSEDDFLRSLNKEPEKSKSDRLKRFDSDEVDTTEIKKFLEEKRKLKEQKEDRDSEEDVNIRPEEEEVKEPEEQKEKEQDWKQLRKKLRLEKEAKKARNLRTRSLPKSMANKRNNDEATQKNYASQIQSYRTPALSKRREPTIEELKAELEPITISARRREFKRNETRMKVAELRKKVRQKMEDIERRTMLKEDHNVALLPSSSHAVDTTISAESKGTLSVFDQKNRKRSSVDHNLLWMVGEDLVGSNDSPATPKRGNSLRGSPAIEMEEEGEHQLPPIAIVVETNGTSSLRTSPEHDGEEEIMQDTEKEEKEKQKKQKEEKQLKKKEKRKQKQQEKQEQIEKGGGEQPSLQPPGVIVETHKEKV